MEVIDALCFGRPTRGRWLMLSWAFREWSRPVGAFAEQIARPRALLTTGACRWAIEQIRREHASIQGLAR